ncbi:MAG: hypothetical protein HOV80_11510 [Polyangiaceae bacterium]|nr:hypothetical protein [Polyangiaceae bacterium]
MKVGPVRACDNTRSLELVQSGTTVSGSEQICSGPCLHPLKLVGEIRDGHIVVRGQYDNTGGFTAPNNGVVIYDLRYDPGTDQLTGTRNGEPVAAARFIKITDPECARIIY